MSRLFSTTKLTLLTLAVGIGCASLRTPSTAARPTMLAPATTVAHPPGPTPTATRVPATFLWNASVYTEPRPSSAFSAAKVGLSDNNVTYCIVGGVELKLDIFYPSVPPTRSFPLVVRVHGGGLSGGGRGSNLPNIGSFDGPAYIARGYAFASIDYRLAPEHKLPTMIEDTKCAIRYLRARAASYNINPDRIGLVGASSGAYLVAMLGLTDASAGFEGRGGFDGVSSSVQAVVAVCPQVSFELPSFSVSETESRNRALPANSSSQFLRAVSLPTYVSRDAPPFLFFHGEFDAALSPRTSLELHAKLAAAGVDSTYVLVKRAGHGWLPTSMRLPNTPYGPEPTAQEITNAQLNFFDKHLKK